MVNNPLKTLISKLDTNCYKALEEATSICVRLTHYDIEIEHWLLALLECKDSLMVKMLIANKCDVDRLYNDINLSLEALRRGNTKPPAISNRLIDLINEAWLIASLDYDGREVDSGIILCALLQNHTLNQICHAISKEFMKIEIGTLRDLMMQSRAEKPPPNKKSPNNTPALEQFAINLNAQAQLGKIDPAIGRENEIGQIVDILSRRKQNNAILTGEPGVGKTAIVEGLALRIVEQDVPNILKKVTIYALDLGLLQAGAGVKGEFENRLKKLIDEIKQAPFAIILFIDEAHTMIGAGAEVGQGDAANLLKPALARGELRCIAATTWAEYKKYFEKDAALTRRFQVVKIEEPDTATAMHMLRGLSKGFAEHHKVKILDSAISAATLLSLRYISGRYLPDKAISVLDTACSRVSGRQTAQPIELNRLQKLYDQLKLELDKLHHEKYYGFAHQERIESLEKNLATYNKQKKVLENKWKKEKQLANKIISLSAKRHAACNKKLQKLQLKLTELQGDDPLVSPYVDGDAVAGVVADWTGIPVGRMLKDEIFHMLQLETHLQKRIIGQDNALQAIAASLRTSSAKLADPNKPIGVFLFVGPSGVGKTETALALAEFLYDSENKMTVINMSEFKEEHKISMLSGSPPGYVGYGEGGVLTEAVRRSPYGIVLLDEMEKAHPGVQEVFYQVFDKGMLKDGQGRDINFKNTLIIMTSNACQNELPKTFKPAFLGRVTIVPFLALSDEILHKIINLRLNHINNQLKEQHKINFTFHKDVVEFISTQCVEQSIGARQVNNILRGKILPKLSEIILSSIMDNKKLTNIKVKLKNDDFVYISE
jgi:type VI secretion system protein VasG